MKFGIRNTSFVYPRGTENIWEDTKAHIQRAEQDGFDAFWVMDHFYQFPVHGSVQKPFLDWTVLPALAAVTSRIRLGAMVSPVGYRNPALLARMGFSLDHISKVVKVLPAVVLLAGRRQCNCRHIGASF